MNDYAVLLGRPARRIINPEFDILGEPLGLAQIFSVAHEDREEAIKRVYTMADRAIVDGRGGVVGSPSCQARYMRGQAELTERFGVVPAYKWRLAILRPLTLMFDEREHLWTCFTEFGLDIDERVAQPGGFS